MNVTVTDSTDIQHVANIPGALDLETARNTIMISGVLTDDGLTWVNPSHVVRITVTEDEGELYV